MSKNKNEFLPVFLSVRAGLAVCLISFLVDIRIGIAVGVAKAMGILIVAIGMGIIIWAVLNLKSGFMGRLEPELDAFVQDGPYRFTRHPVYLGMTIALLGVTIALRSLFGLLAVFTLYLPATVYRARLEEEALEKRFGETWNNYVAQTGFFLPTRKKK